MPNTRRLGTREIKALIQGKSPASTLSTALGNEQPALLSAVGVTGPETGPCF